jgi:CheY-like chemotaxis protein
LFTPFQRLGAEFTGIEGTGIGLVLSRRLVEAMDGKIGYVTEPGSGSTFWIELPTDSQAAIPSAALSVADIAPRAVAGGYSLLYVEDNPASLRLMEHLLADLPNVAMLAAPTGPLGLDLAIAHRPDVIVLDLNLPGLSGFDILARLRTMAETRDIPVIALSAAAMPNDIKRGIAAGFFRYLTKPLEVNLLLETIDAALAAARARSVGGGGAGPARLSPIGEADLAVSPAAQAAQR